MSKTPHGRGIAGNLCASLDQGKEPAGQRRNVQRSQPLSAGKLLADVQRRLNALVDKAIETRLRFDKLVFTEKRLPSRALIARLRADASTVEEIAPHQWKSGDRWVWNPHHTLLIVAPGDVALQPLAAQPWTVAEIELSKDRLFSNAAIVPAALHDLYDATFIHQHRGKKHRMWVHVDKATGRRSTYTTRRKEPSVGSLVFRPAREAHQRCLLLPPRSAHPRRPRRAAAWESTPHAICSVSSTTPPSGATPSASRTSTMAASASSTTTAIYRSRSSAAVRPTRIVATASGWPACWSPPQPAPAFVVGAIRHPLPSPRSRPLPEAFVHPAFPASAHRRCRPLHSSLLIPTCHSTRYAPSQSHEQMPSSSVRTSKVIAMNQPQLRLRMCLLAKNQLHREIAIAMTVTDLVRTSPCPLLWTRASVARRRRFPAVLQLVVRLIARSPIAVFGP